MRAVEELSMVEQIRVYYDLSIPDRSGKWQTMPLLVGLHGYAGTKESMMNLLLRFAPAGFLVAALQGPYPLISPPQAALADAKTAYGWAGLAKREESIRLHHQMILDLIEAVNLERRVDREAIFLVGFSQAVALNYRFAFTYPDLVRGLVAVCGGVPGDLNEGRFSPSDTDILHIAVTSDPYYPVDRSKTFPSLLRSYAPEVELKIYAGGHVFPRRSLGYIRRWLARKANAAPGASRRAVSLAGR